MARTKSILTVDLKNQLVSLRNQGKTLSEMAEITGLSLSYVKRFGSELIKKGLWSYSGIWKVRMKNQKTQTTTTENSESKVKRVYNKRQPQKVDTITINFKGVNVEVQKSSNIIITDTVIYVK
jgi:hypothetical protein